MTTPTYADLERRMSNLELRLTWLDEHGTRGVGTVQTQVTELAKDVGKLETQIDRVNERIDTNTRQLRTDREADEARRVSAFRWRVGAIAGSVASLAAVFGLLLDIATHIR
jgi:uncharacterized coiled-coil protein SlyX